VRLPPLLAVTRVPWGITGLHQLQEEAAPIPMTPARDGVHNQSNWALNRQGFPPAAAAGQEVFWDTFLSPATPKREGHLASDARSAKRQQAVGREGAQRE
jgi:hypothetical protein